VFHIVLDVVMDDSSTLIVLLLLLCRLFTTLLLQFVVYTHFDDVTENDVNT
jgi:hypothetical protein